MSLEGCASQWEVGPAGRPVTGKCDSDPACGCASPFFIVLFMGQSCVVSVSLRGNRGKPLGASRSAGRSLTAGGQENNCRPEPRGAPTAARGQVRAGRDNLVCSPSVSSHRSVGASQG